MVYYFDFSVILKNLDVMLLGILRGLSLAAISLLFGVLIGIILACFAVSKYKWAVIFSRLYVTILRNTPLLVLVYIVYFGFPDFGWTISKNGSFVLPLSLYAGGYLTEVFRAGLQAIPYGLIEAGQSIGLGKGQIVFNIQLPIMVRNVLPATSNTFIGLFKDTALAASITIEELTYVARKINTETFRVFEAWISAAILYVIICYGIAFILRRIEQKFKIR